MILIAPGPETKVIRQGAGFEKPHPGVWHIAMRQDDNELARCRYVVSGSIYPLEVSTLGEATGRICHLCWPYEVAKKGKA